MSLPAWDAALPRSLGAVLSEMCSTDTAPQALGGTILLPPQRVRLQCVDEGVKDTLGRTKTVCVQAQNAYEVLLTCPALG